MYYYFDVGNSQVQQLRTADRRRVEDLQDRPVAYPQRCGDIRDGQDGLGLGRALDEDGVRLP